MIKRMILIYLAVYLLSGGIVFVPPSSAQEEKTYTIAVIDLEPNQVSAAESRALSDKLRSHVSQLLQRGENLKAKYTLIERSQMDKILDQFEVQSIGCVSDSCAVEFGKMLGVDRIVIGSISMVGKTYSVIARIVDVESSKTISSSDRQRRGSIDDVMTEVMPEVGNDLFLIPQKKSRKWWYIIAGVVVLGAGAGAAMMGGGGDSGDTPLELLPGPPDRPE